jgi:hypothetical protein
VLTEAKSVAVLNFGIHPTPTSLQTDPSGKFIYLVDPGSGAIAGYAVDLNNGNIGRGLFPGPFAAGLGATVISGSADFLYVFARDQVHSVLYQPNFGGSIAAGDARHSLRPSRTTSAAK